MPGQSLNQTYDYGILTQITNGDKEFASRLLCLFVQTVPMSTEKLLRALEEKDFVSLAETAHKLKTTIHTMGIHHLKEPIHQLEEFAKKSDRFFETEKLTHEVARTLTELVSEFRSKL